MLKANLLLLPFKPQFSFFNSQDVLKISILWKEENIFQINET